LVATMTTRLLLLRLVVVLQLAHKPEHALGLVIILFAAVV